MNIEFQPNGLTDLTVDFVADSSIPITEAERAVVKIFFDVFTDVAFKKPTAEWLAKCRDLFKIAIKDLEAQKTAPTRIKSYQIFFDRLTQETTPFAMKAAPDALPLPLSLSLPQKTDLIVHCKNRVFHWMLTERETERSAFSRMYTKKLRGPKEEKVLNEQNTITFRKENSVYELLLNHKQFVYLFFPGILADITFNMTQEQLASVMADLFSEYSFCAKDRRFAERLEGKTLIVESMLTAKSLDILPEELMQGVEFRNKLMRYLAFLMHYGVTTSSNILTNTHLHSLFQTAVNLLEKTSPPHTEDPETRQFYTYFYDAICVIQKEVPALWDELKRLTYFTRFQPLVKPDTPQKSDYILPYRPEQSFLLRDLQTHYNVQLPSLPIPAEKRSQHVKKLDELREMLFTKIVDKPKGLHIIFTQPKDSLRQIDALQKKVMDQFLAPEILHAWKAHIAKVTPETAVDDFVKIWRQSPIPLLLKIVPLLDTSLLAHFYFYKEHAVFDKHRYAPGQSAEQHIRNLIAQCSSPEEVKRLKEAIEASVRKILIWHTKRASLVPQDPKTPLPLLITNLHKLQQLCQTEEPLKKLTDAVFSCLFLTGQHAQKSGHREIFFLQFLLAGELCQMAPTASKRAVSRYYPTTEAHNRLLTFSANQISMSDTISGLNYHLLIAKQNNLTHQIHITSALDTASLEILRKIKQEILSISMISEDPTNFSQDAALFERFLQELEY